MEIRLIGRLSGPWVREPAETHLPFKSKSWQHFRAGSAIGTMEWATRKTNQVQIRVFHLQMKSPERLSLDFPSSPFTFVFQLLGSATMIGEGNPPHHFFERSGNFILRPEADFHFRFADQEISLLVLIGFDELFALTLEEEIPAANNLNARFLTGKNLILSHPILERLSEILFSEAGDGWDDFILEEEIRWLMQHVAGKKGGGSFQPLHAERADADWFQQMKTRLLEVKNQSSSFQQLLKIAGIAEVKRFRKLLKSFYGLSIRDFLTEARITEAQILLRMTDLPIKQIAADTGYQNVHYFSRIFKQYTGVPPAHFQKTQGG